MTDSFDHQQEQLLLEKLRIQNGPHSERHASQLQKAYHDRSMAALSADVYDSAKASGLPPKGWIRASEHLELLQRYAPQLQMTAKQLKDLLQPENSGFRAEIYLPDPKILGPGYRPTVSFKGSSGEVMTENGLRDTTTEDFIANNFPQSIGLETDYYDRAMALAEQLKRAQLDFELTGHSLAGGLASAAAAITGMTATTFNAAGLHPETARRFAQQHGLPVYDVSQRITAYQVQGELLTDGVQRHIHNMDVIRRAELGGLLQETSRLLNELPQGHALLQRQLDKDVPMAAQGTVHDFINALASGNTDRLLRELPLSAGHVVPLAAMTERDGQRVARDATLSLPEMTALAEPVLATLRASAIGADFGERGGTLLMATPTPVINALRTTGFEVGAVSELTAHALSDRTQFASTMAQTAEQLAGAGLAHTRLAAADAEAKLDHDIGQAQQFGASLDASLLRSVGKVLPNTARHWMDEQAQQLEQTGEQAHRNGHLQADQARCEGRHDAAAIHSATQSVQHITQAIGKHVDAWQHDAIATPGHWAQQQMRGTSDAFLRTTKNAPALGAATGAAVGAALSTALEIQPGNYPRLVGAAEAILQSKQVGAEAFDRHLMRSTVLPSMDGHIDQLERAANQSLQQSIGQPASVASPEVEYKSTQDEEAISFSDRLDRMIAAADRGDWKSFDKDTKALADMAPGREMLARTAAMADLEDRLTARHHADMQQMKQEMQQALQQQHQSMSQGRGHSR